MLNKLKLAIILILATITTITYADIDPTSQVAVTAIVDTYVHAYEKQDSRAIANLYAQNGAMIDSKQMKVINGRTNIMVAIKQIFRGNEGATISAKLTHMDEKNNIVRASYLLTSQSQEQNGQLVRSTSRLVVALINQNNQWKILKSELSPVSL